MASSSSSTIHIPAGVRKFFSKFPLYTYPSDELQITSRYTRPTLWIASPKYATSVLSADVECLKWQAYMALLGVKDIDVRWSVAPEGAVEGRLPSLVVVEGGKPDVLGARMIPGWVDMVLSRPESTELEGYTGIAAKDESRAWVALLEGTVHSALMLLSPAPATFTSMLLYKPQGTVSRSATANQPSLSTLLSPPPAPLSGLTSLFPLYGERVSLSSIRSQYHDAIVSLSDRLGDDTWFLGSSSPTALDALVFAYLHCLLSGPDDLRIDVARRKNLVDWERRVRGTVQGTFVLV